MPPPKNRLDLYCCKTDDPTPISMNAYTQLMAHWRKKNIIGNRSRCVNNRIVQGGIDRIWLDQPGKLILYANNQGGFRVYCPNTNQPVAREFSKALTNWRQEKGPRSMSCPACGNTHDLDALQVAPPIQFANGALVFSGVNDIDLTVEAIQDIRSFIGPFKVVMTRRS